MVWPAIIGAGAALLGGALSSSSQRSSDASNRALSAEQTAYQKEFAKHGVRWKVADTKAAGLHPLAALGAQTASYQPQRIGETRGTDYSFLGTAGQRIATGMRRRSELAKEAIIMSQERARLRGMELQNQISAKRLQDLNTGGVISTDPLGIVGQGNVDAGRSDLGVVYEPSRYPMSDQVGVQSGKAPMELQVMDQYGGLHRTFNQITQEALENDPYLKTKIFFQKGKRHISRMWPSKKEQQIVRSTRPKSPYRTHEFRWNRLSGNWKLFKIGREGSRLFHPYMRKQKAPYRTPPRKPRKKRPYRTRPHDLHRFDF